MIEKKNINIKILRNDVQVDLVDVVINFIGIEDFYSNKALPYKRGYLLYGSSGSGKTSTIKSLANQYSMDIYIINMDQEINVSTLQRLFKGIKNSKGFNILCFEDFDQNYQIKRPDSEFFRFFIIDLDGLNKTTKRITFFTVNNKFASKENPALMRVGRIDRKVELSYCNDDQIVRLFNHYSCSEEKLENHDFTVQITQAERLDLILNDNVISPTDFKLKPRHYQNEDRNKITFEKY